MFLNLKEIFNLNVQKSVSTPKENTPALPSVEEENYFLNEISNNNPSFEQISLDESQEAILNAQIELEQSNDKDINEINEEAEPQAQNDYSKEQTEELLKAFNQYSKYLDRIIEKYYPNVSDINELSDTKIKQAILIESMSEKLGLTSQTMQEYFKTEGFIDNIYNALKEFSEMGLSQEDIITYFENEQFKNQILQSTMINGSLNVIENSQNFPDELLLQTGTISKEKITSIVQEKIANLNSLDEIFEYCSTYLQMPESDIISTLEDYLSFCETSILVSGSGMSAQDLGDNGIKVTISKGEDGKYYLSSDDARATVGQNELTFEQYLKEYAGFIPKTHESNGKFYDLAQYMADKFSSKDSYTFDEMYSFLTGVEYNQEKVDELQEMTPIYQDILMQYQANEQLEQMFEQATSPTEILEYYQNTLNCSKEEAIELFNQYYEINLGRLNEKNLNNSFNYSVEDIDTKCTSLRLSDDGQTLIEEYPINENDFNKLTLSNTHKATYDKENGILIIETDVESFDINNANYINNASYFYDFNKTINSENIISDLVFDEYENSKYSEQYGSFEELTQKYLNLTDEVYGKNILNDKFNMYVEDMETYTSKFANTITQAGFYLSFVNPAFGFAALIGSYSDNAMDGVNILTNEVGGEFGAWAKQLTKESFATAIGLAIGHAANKAGNYVTAHTFRHSAEKLASTSTLTQNATNKLFKDASIFGTITETSLDFGLSYPADVLYEAMLTGKFNWEGNLVGNILGSAMDIKGGISAYRAIKNNGGVFDYTFEDGMQLIVSKGSNPIFIHQASNNAFTDIKEYNLWTEKYEIDSLSMEEKLNMLQDANCPYLKTTSTEEILDSLKEFSDEELKVFNLFVINNILLSKKGIDISKNCDTLNGYSNNLAEKILALNDKQLSAYINTINEGNGYNPNAHTYALNYAKLNEKQLSMFNEMRSIKVDTREALAYAKFNKEQLELFNEILNDFNDPKKNKASSNFTCTLSDIEKQNRLKHALYAVLIPKEYRDIYLEKIFNSQMDFLDANNSFYAFQSILKFNEKEKNLALKSIKSYTDLTILNATDIFYNEKQGDIYIRLREKNDESISFDKYQKLSFKLKWFSDDTIIDKCINFDDYEHLYYVAINFNYTETQISEYIDFYHSIEDVVSFMPNSIKLELFDRCCWGEEYDINTLKEQIKFNQNALKEICNLSRSTYNQQYGVGELIKIALGLQTNLLNLNFSNKTSFINDIEKIISSSEYKNFSDKTKKLLDLEKKVETLKKSLHNIITPTEISTEQGKQFATGFLANNNPKIENALRNANFAQYQKEGLPLEYSRSDFLGDLIPLIKKEDGSLDGELAKKIGIEPIADENGNIYTYDGIIDFSKLDTQNPKEKALYEVCHKFIKENKVRTGDANLDNILNSLIQGMPEFINTIGKNQVSSAHQMSLDCHILTVLKEALSSPLYQNLSDIDKTVLKMSVILHDIAKAEGYKAPDKSHPITSSLFARDILSKFTLPTEIKDRIFEMVKNHHWLEQRANGVSDAKIASYFRHKDDYTIAKIIAEADLKGVSSDWFNRYSTALNDENLASISNVLNTINQNGQIVLTTRIVKPQDLPKVNYNGEEYTVINFAQLDKDTDLSKMGFAPGITPKNLRLFVHMAESSENLSTVLDLSDIANSGLLCASFVSLSKKDTYYGYKFGVSLESENVNIANATNENQGSGVKKDFSNFAHLIADENTASSEYRKIFSEKLKETLGFNDRQYQQLYEQIANKKHITQISDDTIFFVDGAKIQGSDLKTAISNAQDYLLSGDKHSEANLYNAKVGAFVAKVNDISEIPEEFLKFAKENNLPIFILGSQEKINKVEID